MAKHSSHRKQVRHYHDPGDLHELTFSCYQRRPLLTNDLWRRHLSQSISQAVQDQDYRLVAFVYMPEHVHLLVYPTVEPVDIDRFLAAVKRPCSAEVKANLQSTGSRLLHELTVRERPGKWSFRFWQEGPGYDRNLKTPEAVLGSIDYLHLNPVRRGLCQEAVQWRWSSARWYQSEGRDLDGQLPQIDGVPADLW
jgi:putative transposase